MVDNQLNNDESTAFINELKELYQANKYKEAAELLMDFLKYKSVSSAGLIKDVMNEVVQLTASLNPQSSIAEMYYISALAFYFLNEYDKAIENCNKFIELNPKYVSVYIIRGNCYNELKEYDQAILDFSKAIEIDPMYISSYNNLGITYNRLKQYKDAITYFSKAIELEPEFGIGYYNRGNSYKALKEYSKAIENFSKAIQLNPDYDNAYRNRADAYTELKQYDKAIIDYSRIITHSKNEFFINLAKSKLEEIEKQKDAEEYAPISDLVEAIKSLLVFQGDRVTHYSSLSTARILIFDKNNDQNKIEKDKIEKDKIEKDNRNKFRLSEGSFLNDTSEGQVLFDFLEMKEKSLSKNVAKAKVFIEKPFIGSFVAGGKSNDLTLWRMYGKEAQEEAKGCSITIDSKKFLEDLRAKHIPSNKEMALNNEGEEVFSFFQVAYITNGDDPKFIIPSTPGKISENEKALNDLMTQLKQKIKELPDTIKPKTAQNIKEKLEEIAYLFKSIEYQYEHEVRLIVSLSTLFKRELNTNRTPPGVYIELVDILPSVCRITLGPKVALAEEWAAALHYDITNKGHQAEVFVSHLPYK